MIRGAWLVAGVFAAAFVVNAEDGPVQSGPSSSSDLTLGPFENPGPKGAWERRDEPFGSLKDHTGASPALASSMDGGVLVSFTLPKDQRVTLNITRPDGWVVRELLVDVKLKAGEHRAFWDGRDNMGRILPPGSYQSRVLTHDSITWDYITTVGNGGTPPWRTPDRKGGWVCNHGCVHGVAADKTGIYICSGGNEGPFSIIKRSHDGHSAHWGITHVDSSMVASDGKHVFAVTKSELRKIDATTGELVVLGKDEKNRPIRGIKVSLKARPDTDDEKTPLAANIDSIPKSLRGWGDGKGKDLLFGLAAGGGRVYLSAPWQNRIQVFDAATLKRRESEDIKTFKRPRSLVYREPGRLFVCLEKEIHVMDLKAKSSRKVVAADIEGAFGLAVSGQGTIFVSDFLARVIKVFSADGKLQRGIGDPVKHPVLLKTDYFGGIYSIAALPDDTLWFVQTFCRRVGRIDGRGKLLYHAIGGTNYAGDVAPNPLNPKEVFFSTFFPASAIVDYEKQRLTNIAYRRFEDGPHIEDRVFKIGGSYGFGDLRVRKGKLYAYCGKEDKILRIVTDDGVRPVVLLNATGIDNRVKAFAAKKGIADPKEGHKWYTIWTDQNNDCNPQAAEIAFHQVPKQYPGLYSMTDDFMLFAAGYTWKPRRFNEHGVPIYDPGDIQFHPGIEKHPFASRVYANRHFSAGAVRYPDGSYVGIQNSEDPFSQGGTGFWGGRCGATYFFGYDKNWELKWCVGQKARGLAKPGHAHYLCQPIGTLDDCTFVGDVEGLFHIIHKEGFYVQRILQDGRSRCPVGPDLIRVENFSGKVYRHPKTGKVYFYATSTMASHIWELAGFDSVKVSEPNPLTLTTAAIPKQALDAHRRGSYVIKRMPDRIAPASRHSFFPTRGLDWLRAIKPMPLYHAGKLVAEVRMAYTSSKLNIATVLMDSSFLPIKGVGRTTKGRKRIETLAPDVFRKGDLLEFHFGFDEKADPKRTGPVRGDVHVVLTAVDDKGNLAPAIMHAVHPYGRQENAARYELGGKATEYDSVILDRKKSRAGRYKLPVGGQTAVLASLDLGDLHTLSLPPAPKAEPSRKKAQDNKKRKKRKKKPPPSRTVNLTNRTVRLNFVLTRRNATTGKRERIALTGPKSLASGSAMCPAHWGGARFDAKQAAPGESQVAAVPVPKGHRVVVDGDHRDWNPNKKYFAPSIRVVGPTGEGVGDVRLTYDEKFLYALMWVPDATPHRNSASTPELLFKGGDAVALCFGKPSGKGVQKILFGRHGRGGRRTPIVGVVYRPKSHSKKPYTFESPVGKVTMDYVATEPKIQTFGAARWGAAVMEVAIPIKILGFKPAPGVKVPFDFQIIHSDASGSVNAFNAWWHSRSANASATDDIPTEAKLYPKEWGTLVFK